jgi:hypothetical protein
MSAPQAKWLVGHECTADERVVGHECAIRRGVVQVMSEGKPAPYYDLVSGIVNVADHLWWVSLGLGEEPTQVVFFWFAQPPLCCSTTPNPMLGASGFIRGGCFLDRRFPCLLTNG